MKLHEDAIIIDGTIRTSTTVTFDETTETWHLKGHVRNLGATVKGIGILRDSSDVKNPK